VNLAISGLFTRAGSELRRLRLRLSSAILTSPLDENVRAFKVSPAVGASLHSLHAPGIGAVTYVLNNQRPGTDYGLRLDNLVTQGMYFFDFEYPGAKMLLSYDSATKQVHIFGVAFGGKSGGSRFSTDPGESGFWDINFTYRTNVQDNGSGDPSLLEIFLPEREFRGQ
jgi:hypothetical protein